MTAEPHTHGVEELCEAGNRLYARALHEGRVPVRDSVPAPCLVDNGLLHADLKDPQWLRPTPPAVALHHLLRTIEDDIARQRRREERLTETFQPLLALSSRPGLLPETPAITVLRGLERIDSAIEQAAFEVTDEMLTVQPGGKRPAPVLATALPREQKMLSRGGRMRTLYQHTSRHSPTVLAHFEELRGDVEVRTLNEVTERLLIFDRRIAFIPASSDNSVALEVRHPALVNFFVTTFERLWHMATPMWPRAAQETSTDGITTRQRAIAGLLVEGLTDEKIAVRLGMNVRTVRVHIAKLATILGSGSRAQLGYLIGQSGMLERG
ncbi:LuxR C-terminal-related transcriptional regulator [Streptomyces sp. NPDC058001]|uniref:LuxR C-terminal-related transcriptional regulator n=1 Tax=Streptomyces sp. NPDC058001 TaxID=3346300 RepID=UPI0036E99749